MAAGPSDPVASGQAPEEIFREEICTPREFDSRRKIGLSRLLCLSQEGVNLIHLAPLLSGQILSGQHGQNPARTLNAFVILAAIDPLLFA